MAQWSAVVAVALWRLFVVGVPEAVWERFVLHRVVVVVRWRTWVCSRWRVRTWGCCGVTARCGTEGMILCVLLLVACTVVLCVHWMAGG